MENMQQFSELQESEFEKEGKEYRSLKTEKWGLSGIPEDLSKPAYIISQKWHKDWKKYIGFKKKTYSTVYQWDKTGKKIENITTQSSRKHPGPIQNADIIDFDLQFYKSEFDTIFGVILKPELRERVDYKIINSKQWEFLQEKYGGCAIPREKYKPEHFSFTQVEVYFQRLNLIILPNRSHFSIESIIKEKPIFTSKRWTFSQMKQRIIDVLNEPHYGFSFSMDHIRLWKLDPALTFGNFCEILKTVHNTIGNMQDLDSNENPNIENNVGIEFPGVCLELFGPNKTVEKLDIGDQDKIIIETSNAAGQFIFRYRRNVKVGKCEFCYQERPMVCSCKCNEVHYCSETCLKKDEHFHAEKCTSVDINEDLSKFKYTPKSNLGITGLQNLGNTCFMNSGIQCLSNTYQLSQYFLKDLYVPEINKENKLGLQGRMATAYAKLVKLLWYNNETFVSPWEIKRVIGKYHTAFSGFAQQDSQELISAILDALHEDLNRVKDKPYVAQQTTSDPNDNSASQPCWFNHLARNRSVLVDLFHGQYKSVLQCPKCSRYSVAFDPFSVVSLPVPQDKNVCVLFYYVPYDLSKPIKRSSILAQKSDTIDTLRDKISKMLNVPKYGSIFTMISGSTFDRFLPIFSLTRVLGKMQKNQHSYLYIQEINPKYFNGPENIGLEFRKNNEPKPILIENTKKSPKIIKNSSIKSIFSENEEIKESSELRKQNLEFVNGTKSDFAIPEPMLNKSKFQPQSTESYESCDYNNGLNNDMLQIPINIYKLSKHVYWAGTTKERKTFNRIIFVKKSATMKELHMEIFRYFKPLFMKKLQEFRTKQRNNQENNDTNNRENMDTMNTDEALLEGRSEFLAKPRDFIKESELTDEKLFEQLFPGINEINSVNKEITEKEFPYQLNMINVAERNYFHKEKCFFCEKETCDNCPVPYIDTIKIGDMLAKLGPECQKNDYYFHEHRYYSEAKRDFELEIVFNQDPQKSILDLSYMDMVEYDKKGSILNEPALNKSKISIYQCLDLFYSWETLDQNNLWYCSQCKDSVQAKKKMEIIKSPPILILHLKRFKARANGVVSGTGGRLNTIIEFPLKGLDLSKYIKNADAKNEPIYDLYAISNHYGSTGFGHYTAFAWNKENNAWYRFDDAHVSKIEENEVCSSAAYVLFYKRRDLEDEVDFNKIKQEIPEWYRVPIIETKKQQVKTGIKENGKKEKVEIRQNNGWEEIEMIFPKKDGNGFLMDFDDKNKQDDYSEL